MAATVLISVGAGITILWGAAHCLATRPVVAGFGELSPDNRRILTMEWVAEGLALMFLGALPVLLLSVGAIDPTGRLVLRAVVAMLLVMAVWTGVTGARTAILPVKLYPAVKTVAAACLYVGANLAGSARSAGRRMRPRSRPRAGRIGRIGRKEVGVSRVSHQDDVEPERGHVVAWPSGFGLGVAAGVLIALLDNGAGGGACRSLTDGPGTDGPGGD